MSDCLPQILEVMQEMRDRLVRLESRTVQLGDYVGANLRAKQKIEVAPLRTNKRPAVTIDALDVSLSRIFKELNQADVEAGDVDIICNGERIALLFFTPKETQHG